MFFLDDLLIPNASLLWATTLLITSALFKLTSSTSSTSFTPVFQFNADALWITTSHPPMLATARFVRSWRSVVSLKFTSYARAVFPVFSISFTVSRSVPSKDGWDGLDRERPITETIMFFSCLANARAISRPIPRLPPVMRTLSMRRNNLSEPSP